MDHLKPYDIPTQEEHGAGKKRIFGKNGYIPFGDGSMSLVEIAGDTKLPAQKCAQECICYVIEAENAFVSAGGSPDALPAPEPLKTGDVVLFSASEWYCFETRGSQAKLLLSEFVPDPNAEFSIA